VIIHLNFPCYRNPWWSLPFEALEAISIHLTAVAMSMFCASSAPLGLLATLQTLSRAFYYSIGIQLNRNINRHFLNEFSSQGKDWVA
jgi:MFS_1 like family